MKKTVSLLVAALLLLAVSLPAMAETDAGAEVQKSGVWYEWGWAGGRPNGRVGGRGVGRGGSIAAIRDGNGLSIRGGYSEESLKALLDEGLIAQEVYDAMVEAINSASTTQRADRVTQWAQSALKGAVEQGVISQETADAIAEAISGGALGLLAESGVITAEEQAALEAYWAR